MFCKVTFVIGKNDLSFGMYSSINLAPRKLDSADSPKTFLLLFLALGNIMISWSYEF